MIDSDTQAKLDKLAKIEEKNRERAKRYLERVKEKGGRQLSAILSAEAYNKLCRIRDASVQAGNPISFGKIIEAALDCYTDSQRVGQTEPKDGNTRVDVNENEGVNINEIEAVESQAERIEDQESEVEMTPHTQGIEPTDKQINESQANLFDDGPEPVGPKPKKDIVLPDYLIGVDPNMPIEKRHKIILRLAEDFPDRKNAQIRIDLLNAAGILIGGKPWKKTKQFADQLSIARRWAKKQKTKK